MISPLSNEVKEAKTQGLDALEFLFGGNNYGFQF